MKLRFFLILFLLVTIASAQDLRVMTYNIKYDNPGDTENNWQKRKSFMLNQLRFHAPDVFGVQEALVNQMQDLDNGLEDYDYTGVGRDNGKEKGEYSAIFYNKKNLKFIDGETFWLSPMPDVPSKGWDAAILRICTYAHFMDKRTGEEFYMFNTHFDHIGDVARLESAKLILKKMKEINTKDLPVILTGDFNLTPETEGIKAITKEMKDSYALIGDKHLGPDGTFNGFHFNEPVTNRIDYIFLSKGVDVLKQATLSDNWDLHYPSDHLPVVADLEF